MAIEGSIKDFPLVDVLSLIINTRKNGVLSIKGKKDDEPIIGDIYISNGKIVNAISRNLEGEEAFINLFFIDEGDFIFNQKEVNVQEKITKSFESLMIDTTRLVDETKDLYSKIPPLFTILETNPNIDQNKIELNDEEWRVLYSFINPRPIEDVIKSVDLPTLKVVKIIFTLISSGLVKKSETLINVSKYIYDKVFDYINKKLGPKAIYPFTFYFEKGIIEANKLYANLNLLEDELTKLFGKENAKDTIIYIKNLLKIK